jgi:hypothetical protein
MKRNRLATPNARDVKGFSTMREKHGGRSLNNDLGVHGRVRLSPRFVEWMMGLPEGWTEIGPSESTPSEMQSSHRQPRKRGASSGGG